MPDAMTDPIVATHGISFAYAERMILHDVSLAVARGQIVGLLGPNGSGKTTLLRLIAGTLSPRHGRVTVGDEDVSRLSRREIARRLAVVPQETHSTFDFSVQDIVLMGRYPHLGAFELEGPSDLAIAREALSATGTLGLEHRPFATLSGGEKQRVVIASALAQASEVLLLDEPTASLDVGYQIEIAALLTRLNRERATTMVVSTHDLNLAASLCTELILIRSGRIVAQGDIRSVLTPEIIGEVFDVDVEVAYHSRAGHMTVIPIGRAH